MLILLNIFFFLFHTLWILFNMIGWAWKQTRFWHRLTLALTAGSWFVLGRWYGWGYCLCTDWHWQVRQRMGFVDHDGSYTHFLLHKMTGLDLSYGFTDTLTGSVFGMAIVLNVVFSLRDWKRKNRRLIRIAD
jgi:hypothetical protein